MKAVAGVFTSGPSARNVARRLHDAGLPEHDVALLSSEEDNDDNRAAGGKVAEFISEGLPEDELFFYEDALRHGGNVIIALAPDERMAVSLRSLMEQHGAEAIDAVRDKWWTGLRGFEKDHYTAAGGDFVRDELFYRLGFQAALHARTRGKEYDQVLSEMAQDIEDLKKKYPESELEGPFRRGYERGRAYAESCRQKRGW